MKITRQAVVLVGGRGTRLGALTDDTPKPLLDVAGRPFLAYLLDAVIRQGYDKVLLLAGYRALQVEQFVAAFPNHGASVEVVTEDQPMGTGGALYNARDRLDDTFVLMNGDTFFDINLNAFAAPPLGQAQCRLALRKVEDTARYGRVELDGGRVLAMQEKGIAGPGLINGGIYLLAKSVIAGLGPRFCSLESEIFPQLLARDQLAGTEFDGYFLDIGIPVDYQAAQTSIPQLARRPVAFLDRDGVLNEDDHYAHRPEQIRWVAGAFEAVRLLNERGYHVCVVTNQAGIARGMYDAATVRHLHHWMQQELRQRGAHIDNFQFCPHHPEFDTPCACRKPAPGMLEAGAASMDMVREGSFLIGDKQSDLDAAARFGIPGHAFAPDQNLHALVRRILPQ